MASMPNVCRPESSRDENGPCVSPGGASRVRLSQCGYISDASSSSSSGQSQCAAKRPLQECTFPLITLRKTVPRKRLRFGRQVCQARQTCPGRRYYLALLADLYLLSEKKGASPPSGLESFKGSKTVRIDCERLPVGVSQAQVDNTLRFDVTLRKVTYRPHTSQSAENGHQDVIYDIEFDARDIENNKAQTFYEFLLIAIAPAPLLCSKFLFERDSLNSYNVFRDQAQRSGYGNASGYVRAENDTREARRGISDRFVMVATSASELSSSLSALSDGAAALRIGAELTNSVAKPLGGVAVVGPVFFAVSVVARGVSMGLEAGELKGKLSACLEKLEEYRDLIVDVLVEILSCRLSDNVVVRTMFELLVETCAVSQMVERCLFRKSISVVALGSPLNDVERRLDKLKDSSACFQMFKLLWRKVSDTGNQEDAFVGCLRAPPRSDIVEEALPGLADLKRCILLEHEVAVTGQGSQVLGATGDGGVGKTTACVFLCHDLGVGRRFADGIHFLQFGLASTDREVADILCGTVHHSGGVRRAAEMRAAFGSASSEDDPLLPVVHGVKEWFSGKRILLVCDNVSERLRSGFARRWSLPKLLQIIVEHAPESCLLVTTRYSELVCTLPRKVKFHTLENIERRGVASAARDLIEMYAGYDAAKRASRNPQQAEARDELIRICAGLQLLLCVCGNVVRESDGNWIEVVSTVENNKFRLLELGLGSRGSCDPLRIVLESSLDLLERSDGSKSAGLVTLDDVRQVFGPKCFRHLYSLFGVLKGIRRIPSRLWRSLFGGLQAAQAASHGDTEQSTAFDNVCLGVCRFLKQFGLLDLVRDGEEYCIELHDSKYIFCRALCTGQGAVWSSEEVCDLHLEFLREVRVRWTRRSQLVSDVDWASVCDMVTAPRDAASRYLESNLVHHVSVGASEFMRRSGDIEVRTMGLSAAETRLRDSYSLPFGFSQLSSAKEKHERWRDAFELLMGTLTDFRWIRARAFSEGRRGVVRDLDTAFASIVNCYRNQSPKSSRLETKGVDSFCDDDVDSSYFLKGELAAIKVLRWVIMAVDELCFEIPSQPCTALTVGGNVLCFEIHKKCMGFESLAVWRDLSDAARARAQARVHQFVASAEAYVGGPWWKPIVRGGSELSALSQTRTRFITTGTGNAFCLGRHCGLVTLDSEDASRLTLSDDICGCPEKNYVAAPRSKRLLRVCVLEDETTDGGDVIAALDSEGCVFLWKALRTRSGLTVQRRAELSAKRHIADAGSLRRICGVCIGRQGKVVAAYNRNEVFVWAEHQHDDGGQYVFRGLLGIEADGEVKEVHVSKNAGAIVVLRDLGLPSGSVLTYYKDAGASEYSEIWTAEGCREEDERVTHIAVAGDSSCVYTSTCGGRLSRVNVASGSESSFAQTDISGQYLTLLEDRSELRILGVAGFRDVEWWTDGSTGAGAGFVCGWRGRLADGLVYDLHVRWAGGSVGGGCAGRVFESFTSHWDGVWRIRRWRVGADGRVSPVGADGCVSLDSGLLPREVAQGVMHGAHAPKVRQFAVSSSCVVAVVAELGVGGVSVWDVRTGERSGCLTSERASAVDVCADGSIAVAAREKHDSKGYSVAVWDVYSRTQLADLAGNGESVCTLMLCGSSGSDGGRLWVVAGGERGSLFVGDCRTGQWLHKIVSGQQLIASLGYASPQSSARDRHEFCASATTQAEAGAESAMDAWIASLDIGETVLWKLSHDGKLTKYSAQPTDSKSRSLSFQSVSRENKLHIEDWRRVPCGTTEFVAARRTHAPHFFDRISASFLPDNRSWRFSHGDHSWLASCQCPPIALNATRNNFAFVSMPRSESATGASDLAAVTVGTDSRLQIWHLKLGKG